MPNIALGVFYVLSHQPLDPELFISHEWNILTLMCLHLLF